MSKQRHDRSFNPFIRTMTPRKTILKELSRADSDAGVTYVRPSAIPGFSDRPEKYQKAVNELLKDRLLEGRPDDEGHMAIAINRHRQADVEKELRPVWAKPGLWLTIFVLAAAAGAAVTL